MKQNFSDRINSLKECVIEEIEKEVENKGGEIELSTDGAELMLDLSTL